MAARTPHCAYGEALHRSYCGAGPPAVRRMRSNGPAPVASRTAHA